MPRFFITKEQFSDGVISITGEDAFHIARAQRMAVGEEIVVCDTEGTTYICRLDYIRDDIVQCTPLSQSKESTEPPVEIHLFMAWPKGDKLETIVQKATELGVTSVTPFSSQFCIKHPKDEKLPRQLARLARIAEEAAKQSGRSKLPEIRTPLSFSEAISAMRECQLPLLCYESEAGHTLRTALEECTPLPASIGLMVGSEGGFSESEVKEATQSGILSVGLGKRILRCETAPVVALSCILFHTEL